ncbi:MAG: hypothetical protein AB1Z23_05280 [Eubacteriales bacterium]
MKNGLNSFNKAVSLCLIITLVFSISIFSSCAVKPYDSPQMQNTEQATIVITSTPAPATPTPTDEPTPTIEPTATPRSGPQVVGIYVSGSGGRVLLTEYKTNWNRGEDIATFNTFASNEPLLNYAKYREMLVKEWFSYPDAKDYKIGYTLSYTLYSGEEFSITIRKPSDVQHTEYLEVYLYDSVQQSANAGWYTHLADENIDDETLLYSFKLTPGVKIKEVEKIKLEAFVYKYMDESDFDETTGEYIGTVSYEIDIVRR